MNLSDITAAIVLVDATFDQNYGVTDINAMKRAGWEEAIAAQIAENPAHVTSATISGGAVSSGTNNDWGLDHFKPRLRAVLLNETTLLPYKATLADFKKYMVIVNANIHRFTDTSDSYFDVTHEAAPHFCAAYYFDTKGQDDNHDTATENGNDQIEEGDYPT